MITEKVTTRQISAKLEDGNILEIKAYLLGAIYCWCKNCKENEKKSKWFAARDFIGGDNYFWEKTPLFKIYEWHKNNEAEDPENMAGKDVGNLLKEILKNDEKRKYNTRKKFTREYQWTGEEVN